MKEERAFKHIEKKTIKIRERKIERHKLNSFKIYYARQDVYILL